MGRPTLDLGTTGKTRIYATSTGFRALVRIRDYDGKLRLVERSGPTRSAATRALALAIRDRSQNAAPSDITPQTTISDLADRFLEEIRESDLSPSTVAAYTDRVEKQIRPELAGVRIREVTVGLLDRHLKTVKARHGASMAKTTKSVLSGMFALATRHDAISHNPVRDTARIPVKPRNPAQRLEVAELQALRATLLADPQAHERDIVDIIMFMIATGARIGEVLALHWDQVDLERGTVEIRSTAIRIKGQGIVIKPSPKSSAGERVLELPGWCVRTLAQRERPASGLVFPGPRSGLVRDPSNTLKMMHKSVGKLKSHTYRKSLASIMDDAKESARHVADQLGHASPSFTQDKYLMKKTRATGAAALIEDLFDDVQEAPAD